MNKTIKAWLLGYIFFKVNNKQFYLHSSAQAEANRLKDVDGNISFSGWNIYYCIWRSFRHLRHRSGWLGFYYKVSFTGFEKK